MKIIQNAVCPACTLLCDDVTFQIDGAKITTDVKCAKAQTWTDGLTRRNTNDPALDVEGTATAIAQSLTQSKMPLIAGIGNLTTEAQQAAFKIADVCKAAIDVSLFPNHQSSLYALQRQGKITASLGEIATRGDVVVFWFCDPVKTHPRLLERLRLKTEKRIVVVDSVKTQTADAGDDFIKLNEGDAIDFLSHAQRALASVNVASVNGMGGSESKSSLENAAGRFVSALQHSSFGSLFYGHLTDPMADQMTTLSHQKLVRRLNDFTRVVSVGLRDDANGLSAENVLAAFTGYPMAVSLATGRPQYQAMEFSAATLLARSQCDYLLWFAGANADAGLRSLADSARKHFSHVAKTILSSSSHIAGSDADFVPVATAGFDDGGEYCRFDDVPLPLVALAERSALSAALSAERLLKRVAEILGV